MAVRECEVCQQSYVTMHLGDDGVCRLCEMRETPWRRKIAAEIQALGGSAFIVESIKRGPHRLGGISNQAAQEYDPHH